MLIICGNKKALIYVTRSFHWGKSQFQNLIWRMYRYITLLILQCLAACAAFISFILHILHLHTYLKICHTCYWKDTLLIVIKKYVSLIMCRYHIQFTFTWIKDFLLFPVWGWYMIHTYIYIHHRKSGRAYWY